MDFIYFDEDSLKRKIFHFAGNQKKEIDFADYILSDEQKCLKEIVNFPIATEHSSAFGDINGDCVSDILIHSRLGNDFYLEIWLGMKIDNKIKYCLKEKKLIDKRLGLFSLVDINVDGQLDLAFPVINSKPPQIFIAYNQIKVQNDWSNNYCETAQKKIYYQNETLFSDLKIDIITNVIFLFSKFYFILF
jgi:hypothetical protein